MTGQRRKERGRTGSVKGRSVRRDARRKRSCERRRGRKSERESASGRENASGRESVSVKGAAKGVTRTAGTQVGLLTAAGADHETEGGAEARTGRGRGTGNAAGTHTHGTCTQLFQLIFDGLFIPSLQFFGLVNLSDFGLSWIP